MPNYKSRRLQISVTSSADETENSNTTLVNHTALKIALKASKSYSGYLLIFVKSHATADLKYKCTIPSGATSVACTATLGTTTPLGTAVITTQHDVATDDTTQCIFLPIYIKTSTTAGDIQFQFAQLTSDVNNTTILAGSSIHLIQS